MATLTNINGRRIVQVFVRDRRRTISVGRMSYADAQTIKGHVERLARAVDWSVPAPVETLKWLAGVSDRLHRKLAKIGLTEPRVASGGRQLKAYFESYVARRSDLKPGSVKNINQAKAFAVAHFGATRDMASITVGDVKDWRRALAAKYSTAYVAQHVKKLRQVFADAVDRKLIAENPFTSVKAGRMSNPERLHYVTKDDIGKVIDVCPDHEWRLLFALARYAGLRVPSETRAMRWEDVDWARNRFTVRSSKTEHHAGKATRVVPIFPALMPRLLESQSMAQPGAVYVFGRLRHRTLRSMALKLIGRAGLTAWPRIFQNLRSSCETDLAASEPLHLACAWIGNSTGVAIQHYLQVTDDDYSRAAKNAAPATAAGRTEAEPGQLSNVELLAQLKVVLGNMPPVGFLEAANVASSVQKAHRTLQAALHSTNSYAARIRKQLIDNLRQQVDQAKGRGGRR